jgi:cytochrome c oxidase assembly protein subunit 15
LVDDVSRRYALLRRIARLCACLMLVIVDLSAYMRLAGAGLGCADWPRCYGASARAAQMALAPSADPTNAAQAPPATPASGAILAIRSTHRVVATIVLVLVIMLVVLSFASRPVLWREARIALAMLALVMFLAVLGRWTSGSRVPAVAMGNLLAGFAMLALSWRASVPSSAAPPGHPWPPGHLGSCPAVANAGASARRSGLAGWAWLAIVLLVAQAALGALVSASFAGLNCPGFSGCGSAAAWSWHGLDPFREPQLSATLPINPDGAPAQIVHRIGAVVVTLVLAPLGVAAVRRGARRAGAVVLILLAVQLALGVALITASLPIELALAHNLVAALLLTAVVSLL